MFKQHSNEEAATDAYWSVPHDQLLAQLKVAVGGLSSAEAVSRLAIHGPNTLGVAKKAGAFGLYANQFKSPLVLILIVASAVSLAASEWVDAGIVLVVVFGSAALGFVQEYIAGNAVEKLRSQITITSTVRGQSWFSCDL